MVNVAILGYGTVGSGVAKVLTDNAAEIAGRVGEELNIKYVLDLRDFPGDPFEKVVVHDYEVIAADPEVSVVIEVMGGLHPAYEFTKRALESGKSVCTSNKELVAAKGAELLKIAGEHNASYLFEASVGGGIPIIRPLVQALTADKIEEVCGILNGTTNYILTAMSEGGADFDSVLAKAQELGYAERNPEADIEGHDACRKIAILASLVSGKQVDYEDILTEGITKITDEDMKLAGAIGGSIKLLGVSRWKDGKVFARVSPFVVEKNHSLYAVNDVFNGIMVHGNMVGDVMFYGSGAGSLPTASAVVSDVVEIAKNLGSNIPIVWSEDKQPVEDPKAFTCRFLVQVKEGKQAVADAFGQTDTVSESAEDGTVFLTGNMTEAEYNQKVGALTVVRMLRTI